MFKKYEQPVWLLGTNVGVYSQACVDFVSLGKKQGIYAQFTNKFYGLFSTVCLIIFNHIIYGLYALSTDHIIKTTLNIKE